MNNPLFSIIVASYNNGKYLPECLDSLINQTYTNIEIVVVDDDSTDNSVEIVKQYMAKDSRIKLLENKKNRGVGYTKQKGVLNSNGIIIGTIGADDALATNAIELMVRAHLSNEAASLIYSTHFLCNEHLNIIDTNKRVGSINKKSSALINEYRGGNIISSFRTFKSFYYWKTDGFNRFFNKAVDKDIIYKLEEVGETVFISKPLYYYRQQANSISLNKNIWQARIYALKAMTNAYYRRLKMPNIPNLTKEELNSEGIFVYKQSALFELKNKNYIEYIKSIFALLKYLGFKEYIKFVYYSVKKTIKPEKY